MSEARMPGSIRVATVNLFARHGDWERRRPVLRQRLRELDADVLALQEAVVDDDGDTARDLLGDGYEIVHQQQGLVGDGSHHGASVASRWPGAATDPPTPPPRPAAGRCCPSTRSTCT